MNTFASSKTLIALLLALPPTLACEVQEKQIGQLDDEADEADHDDAETGDSLACEEALEFVQAVFDEQGGPHCAMVVLFDYETYEVSNWNIECETGDLGMSVDEAEALTTWGGQDISEPEGESANDRSFIFYSAPDDMGGVGWVSNHVGRLFDASIVAGGVGEIHHPSTLRDPSELGSGCVPPGGAFEWRGYDLTEEPVVYNVPHVEELWAALVDTAVLRAVLLDHGDNLGPGSFTLDALVYPRTMAEFEPSRAEYVLVIEWIR